MNFIEIEDSELHDRSHENPNKGREASNMNIEEKVGGTHLLFTNISFLLPT